MFLLLLRVLVSNGTTVQATAFKLCGSSCLLVLVQGLLYKMPWLPWGLVHWGVPHVELQRSSPVISNMRPYFGVIGVGDLPCVRVRAVGGFEDSPLSGGCFVCVRVLVGALWLYMRVQKRASFCIMLLGLVLAGVSWWILVGGVV